MSERSETCTPEERRLLDWFKATHLTDAQASPDSLELVVTGFAISESGHDMLRDLYAVQSGDRNE